MRCAAAVTMLLLGSAGCSASSSVQTGVAADYPGSLVDPMEVRPDFEWRQEIESEYRGHRHSGEMVVQKTGKKLRVVGLAPWGSPAFVLEQDGQRITFRKLVPVAVPFSPRAVLVDINRAFFRIPESPRPNGTHRIDRDGENVQETWRGGRLIARVFERPGGPPGSIRIHYEGGLLWPTPPKTVELENGWYGYRLRITTLSVAPQ